MKSFAIGPALILIAGCNLVGDCGDRVLQEVPSPNGTLNAVVFQRHCGATTSWALHVAVVPAGERPVDDRGQALVADLGLDAAPLWLAGDRKVLPSWQSDDRLLIRHRPIQIIRRESTVGRVALSYLEVHGDEPLRLSD